MTVGAHRGASTRWCYVLGGSSLGIEKLMIEWMKSQETIAQDNPAWDNLGGAGVICAGVCAYRTAQRTRPNRRPCGPIYFNTPWPTRAFAPFSNAAAD
jgi:hypothetical protein